MCSFDLNIYYLLLVYSGFEWLKLHKYIFNHFKNACYYLVDFTPKHDKEVLFSQYYSGAASIYK